MTLLIFDLDGTLVDTHRDIAWALNASLEAEGHAAVAEPRVRGLIGGGLRALVAAVLQRPLHHPEVEAVRARFGSAYRARPAALSTPFPGVPEALEALRRRDVQLAVATNKPSWLTGPVLEGVGLSSLLSAVASADEAGAKKPDPRVIHLALERLGKPDARPPFVGDTAADVLAARAAGATSVGVSWGYRPEELRAASPDRLLDRAEELLELV